MVGKLSLAAITIVRDEATLLEPFLRHNIGFFDRMFVVDDGSHDATLEIMALLKQEGLDIQLIGQASSGSYYQGPKMKAALAHVLTDGQRDAIVPLDADEFIVA